MCVVSCVVMGDGCDRLCYLQRRWRCIRNTGGTTAAASAVAAAAAVASFASALATIVTIAAVAVAAAIKALVLRRSCWRFARNRRRERSIEHLGIQ